MPAETTPVTRVCPSCGVRLHVDANRQRKKLQCPKCLNAIPPTDPAAPLERARPAPPAGALPPIEDRIRDLASERDRFRELERTAAQLASENAALKTALDQATATIAETAAMVARIKDLDARLTELGANYVRALCRGAHEVGCP